MNKNSYYEHDAVFSKYIKNNIKFSNMIGNSERIDWLGAFYFGLSYAFAIMALGLLK